MTETKNLLLFRKWDLSDIEIVDPGLKTAISLRKQVLPYTFGRSALKRFNKADVNIVERLINKSMHFGKKYADSGNFYLTERVYKDIPPGLMDRFVPSESFETRTIYRMKLPLLK